MAKKSKFNEEELEEIQRQVNDESGVYDYITKDYPFEVIGNKFGEENDDETTLYVPDYQREFVWDNKKQSRFIESVFLGMPLTPFLLSEDDEARMEIIDGSQRIRTLIAFHDNTLRLRKLTKLDKLNGAKFTDLPKALQRTFKNRDFKMIIADKVDDKVKQDIFNRINTSGEPLTDSEIRKGSYAGKFYNMILELKNNNCFRSICPLSPKRENRGEYEELILRFFAYKDKYLEVKSDVAIFLNEYLADMNESSFDEEEYKATFNSMIVFIEKYFNGIGFKKEQNNNSVPRVRFEAIAVGVYLALKEDPDLTDPDMNWIDSVGFKMHTTSDTSNGTNRLKDRIEFVRDGLLGNLDEDRLNEQYKK